MTPLWLSRSWRSFLYSSSVYACHLFLITSASVRSLWFLPLLCPSLHEMFPWYLQFSWRDFWSFPFYCFPLYLYIVHLRRISYLSFLFFGILDSVGYIFSFLPCFLLLCFTLISVHLISPTKFTSPVFRMRKLGFVDLWIFRPSFKIYNIKVEHQEEKFNSFSLLIGDTVGTRQWTLCLVFPFLGFSCFYHS